MQRFALIFCLLLSACTKHNPLITELAPKPTAQAAQAATTAIIWVWGQSNAVGLGQDSPSALPAGIRWRGLDFPRGIGMAFATAYQQKTGQNVIVVQCSVGGTSIVRWTPGADLYNQCFDLLRQSQAEFPQATLATVLFWQGEYDAHEPAIAPQWASLAMQTFAGIRRDTAHAQLPIVFAQIDTDQFFNQAPLYPFWDTIKDQQASLHLHQTEMVRTDDITDIPDSVHVGRQGLATIGQRMFGTYLELL